MRITKIFRLLLIMGFGSVALAVAQDVPPFSRTQEYKSMLTELSRSAPRPSRIANAGQLITGNQPAIAVEEKDSAGGFRLETQVWNLEIANDPFGLSFTNKLTGVSWKLAGVIYAGVGAGAAKGSGANPPMRLARAGNLEKREGKWIFSGAVEGSTSTVKMEIALAGPNAVSVSMDAERLGRETTSEFQIAGPGPYFGLGEQFNKPNLDHFKTNLHPDDHPGTPGHFWDYMSIPLVYTPRGIGVYFDTAFNGVFDSTAPGPPNFKMQFGGASMDFYLLAAPDPKGIVETYTGLTGRTPLPPPWAFGVWHNSLEGSDAVLKDAQALRRAGIPVSALWVSDLLDQSDNIGWPLWTAGYYGSPGAFTQDLHKLGFKVLAYFYPYVRSVMLPYPLENPAFADAVRNHYLVTDPQGEPAGPSVFEPTLTGNVDFTKPQAVDWWQLKIQNALRRYDFDGWMEDFGEWIHDDYHFAAGKTGREMATLNPLFWHKITYEIAHQTKPDVVEFARSGAPGSQAFTRVLWGGDQLPDWTADNGLGAVVTAGVTAGLSGFAVWGPDILSSGTSKELFIRWTEFGALAPIMRDHLWSKPQYAVDLWFDSQTTDVFRRYARLHVALFPYLYTFAQEATQTGLPILRHPMLEFPDDPGTYTVGAEYLLGDRLLVAPVVTEGATTRTLYLPKGSWVNYWNGEMLEGGKDVTVAAPLEAIPIFAKAGSVIPFARPDVDTLAADLAGDKYQTLDNSLVWRIFPTREAATSSFAVYDGAKVSVEQNSTSVRVQGESSKTRQYDVEMNVSKAPSEVVVSGHHLDRVDDSNVHTGKAGWIYEPAGRTLHVIFLGADFTLQVTIG